MLQNLLQFEMLFGKQDIILLPDNIEYLISGILLEALKKYCTPHNQIRGHIELVHPSVSLRWLLYAL